VEHLTHNQTQSGSVGDRNRLMPRRAAPRTRHRVVRWCEAGHRLIGDTVSAVADAWLSATRSSYDTDAVGYAEKVHGLLAGKPYLRSSLALFAELVHGANGGPVADIGCGPGYVTGYLHDAGVDVFGIDLSPEMIAIARRDYPDLSFQVGSMTDLGLMDDTLAGIVAFWSVIHVPDEAMPGVLEQFRRVLRLEGLLLVGFHVGDETRHTSEGYTGRPISVDSHHRQPSEVSGWLRDAGFAIEAELVIGPDEDVPGALIFARRDFDRA
jgi:SAM-dependent methyltransferase